MPHGQAAFAETSLIGEVQVSLVGSCRYPDYDRGQDTTVRVDLSLRYVVQQCAEWPDWSQR